VGLSHSLMIRTVQGCWQPLWPRMDWANMMAKTLVLCFDGFLDGGLPFENG
jgi:hypothetical protein